MSLTMLDPPMAKASRNDVSVKIDGEVAAIAKMVAASRDITLAEYLSETVRPIANADLEKEYARRNPSKKGPKAKE